MRIAVVIPALEEGDPAGVAIAGGCPRPIAGGPLRRLADGRPAGRGGATRSRAAAPRRPVCPATGPRRAPAAGAPAGVRR